jgi:hypothetical protein
MEYSLEFSERLIESAEALLTHGQEKQEAGRAILYLSCLSCEVSLKAALESVGFSVRHLKNRSHHLDLLVEDICECRFIDTGFLATAIRGKVVIPNMSNNTIGALLVSHISACSTYPNQIRYGELVRHFPPNVMLECAKVVYVWCRQNEHNLQYNICP